MTESLDWKLSGFDLLSEHSLPSDFSLSNCSWMVSQAGPGCAGQTHVYIRTGRTWAYPLATPRARAGGHHTYRTHTDNMHTQTPCKGSQVHQPQFLSACHSYPPPFPLQVGNQYKPAELAKSEWETIQQSPPWAVDAWGLGCLMQEVFSGEPMAQVENLRRWAAAGGVGAGTPGTAVLLSVFSVGKWRMQPAAGPAAGSAGLLGWADLLGGCQVAAGPLAEHVLVMSEA